MDGLPENVGSDRRQPAQLTAYSNVFIERLWRSVKYEEVLFAERMRTGLKRARR